LHATRWCAFTFSGRLGDPSNGVTAQFKGAGTVTIDLMSLGTSGLWDLSGDFMSAAASTPEPTSICCWARCSPASRL
jgi:hypothetical protein